MNVNTFFFYYLSLLAWCTESTCLILSEGKKMKVQAPCSDRKKRKKRKRHNNGERGLEKSPSRSVQISSNLDHLFLPGGGGGCRVEQAAQTQLFNHYLLVQI